SVLDDVDAAHAVAAGDLVELLDEFDAVGGLAVERDGAAVLEGEADDLRLVGRVFDVAAEHPDAGGRRVPGVFDGPALVGDVPEVAVSAEDLGGAGGALDVAFGQVVQQILSRVHVPD